MHSLGVFRAIAAGRVRRACLHLVRGCARGVRSMSTPKHTRRAHLLLRLVLLPLVARVAAHGESGWEVLAQCSSWVSLNTQYQVRLPALAGERAARRSRARLALAEPA